MGGLERVAKTACLSGGYAKGVAILAELYVRTKNNTYIYNQARCFEQNGKYEDAIFRFREYQRKRADAGQPPDPTADKHIEDCRSLLDEQRPIALPPTTNPVDVSPAPVATEPAPVSAAASVPEQASQAAEPVASSKPPSEANSPADLALVASQPADAEVAAPRPSRPGAGLRIAGITTGALGIAGVATGVILQLKVGSLTDQLESSPTSYSRSTESTRQSYKTGSIVAYGVGAACLVGGVTLYYLGYRGGKQAQVEVLPAAGVGRVGVSLRGAF